MSAEVPLADAAPDDLLARLQAVGDEARAAKQRAANRTARETWGVTPDDLNTLAADLRQAVTVDRRVLLADALWRAEVFDARMLACKVLTQARIRSDHGAWDLLARWVFHFDCRAIADAGAAAIQRRLMADLARLDAAEDWTRAANVWTRRTALAATVPLARAVHPSAGDLAARERVSGWVAAMADDPRPVIRQAVDGWLRDLARGDPERAAALRGSG
ncbi:DNA alkylation repair protein [Jannaschia rubra]|uniref:DNA alkylation repair protein n=1 Tax=Jannaschia rubra TaxID=282197 RepID=UPI0024918605|nr:DNA alkylation repair protein [Jannaschia rubra]